MLEEQGNNANEYYAKIGKMAEESGCSISVTSIEGSECKMEILG
jgi:hypothetical protein